MCVPVLKIKSLLNFEMYIFLTLIYFQSIHATKRPKVDVIRFVTKMEMMLCVLAMNQTTNWLKMESLVKKVIFSNFNLDMSLLTLLQARLQEDP